MTHRRGRDSALPYRSKPVSLPYFAALTDLLDGGQPDIDSAFGRHVHWGYWADPKRAGTSAKEFAHAAEGLSLELLALAQLADGQRILDAGCGFGGTLGLLAERYDRMHLTGLNLDHGQLLRARRTRGARPPDLRLIQGNACCLPFADGSFDRILAVECIFHFPDRETFLREAFRTLSPGGRLTLSDFVPLAPLRPATWVMAQWPVTLRFYGPCDFNCSLADYRQLARRVGFHIVAERDITSQTLPTYRFLRTLGGLPGLRGWSALSETLLAEMVSRLGLLRYQLLAFERHD